VKTARYSATGAARDVLETAEVPRPEPGAGEVRVRVAVSGVNPTDCKRRAGITPVPVPDGGQIPHHDGAGVIDAVGAGVDGSRIGERVWVWMAAQGRRWGTAAQWTVVPGAQAVPLPARASFDLGAMLGIPAMTAHRCLFADGPLDGKRVLVAGGAGAVGNFAIQLAKAAGAWVASTVSGGEKAEMARAAGADVVVNYREPDAREQLTAAADHVDRIVEVALGANLHLDLPLCRPDTVVCVYASEPTSPTLRVTDLQRTGVVLRFMSLYSTPRSALDRASVDITAALHAGALSALPVQRFALDATAAAHEAVEAAVVGKVLVDIPPGAGA